MVLWFDSRNSTVSTLVLQGLIIYCIILTCAVSMIYLTIRYLYVVNLTIINSKNNYNILVTIVGECNPTNNWAQSLHD